MQPVSNQIGTSYKFDVFEIDPLRRVLIRDGKAIALKPKVFETLMVLVRNSGRVMDKDELMRQVWPDTVVEEVNLAHNISVLRKALGQKSDENRFIITRGRLLSDAVLISSLDKTALATGPLRFTAPSRPSVRVSPADPATWTCHADDSTVHDPGFALIHIRLPPDPGWRTMDDDGLNAGKRASR